MADFIGILANIPKIYSAASEVYRQATVWDSVDERHSARHQGQERHENSLMSVSDKIMLQKGRQLKPYIF